MIPCGVTRFSFIYSVSRLGMGKDIRGELLGALAYDMSLVSRLHEQLVQLLFSFRRIGNISGLSTRFFSAILYFSACRIFHPSAMTVGEELGELVPRDSSRITLIHRMRLLLASMMTPFLCDLIAPYLDNKSPTLAKLLKSLLDFNDAWFFLSRDPISTSLLDEIIRPKVVSVLPDSNMVIPVYVRYLAGFSALVKSLENIREICKRMLPDADLNIPQPLDDIIGNNEKRITCSSGSCSICMGEVRHPTATVCGHVYCWTCIQQWTSQDGSPCPVCRTVSLPHELLPLSNYAPTSVVWDPFWTRPFILS